MIRCISHNLYAYNIIVFVALVFGDEGDDDSHMGFGVVNLRTGVKEHAFRVVPPPGVDAAKVLALIPSHAGVLIALSDGSVRLYTWQAGMVK
jgi:hypothetical protein